MQIPKTFHPSTHQKARRRTLLMASGATLVLVGGTLSLVALAGTDQKAPEVRKDQTTMLAGSPSRDATLPQPLPADTVGATPDYALVTPQVPVPSTDENEKTPPRKPSLEPTDSVKQQTKPLRDAAAATLKTDPANKDKDEKKTSQDKKVVAAKKPHKAKKRKKTKWVTSDLMLLKNQNSGLCADLPTNGVVGVSTPLSQFECVAGVKDNQQFRTLRNGSLIALRNEKTRLCLDVPGEGNVAAGTWATSYDCLLGKNDNQMFTSQPSGNGLQLRNVRTGMCLDVSSNTGASTDRGRKIVLSTCTSSPSQVWIFV
ncbi:RICIN domain-containing protein [Kineosporia sp. NBRC 101677]|uniref:RICIN domain-containing protein n=1 Tax=Kineosporia sp. NBRC 101677 TaxID=3032197 RepID=UPI002552131B|nr:RICIN domain-containing protein [Kineosporia sp. NBRC 101677]